ncbi:MAG TPA: TMEM165/GDT1 family protein [Burkholderiales bacterium]|nr:TMEM165/GDT1 family protein [Burkholderiales bacterium]
MQAFLTSTALVAAAEIGDKTQLLSFVLAARLRRPYPIIAGILAATLFNHTLAGSVGVWLAHVIPHQTLNWMVAAAFIAFGLWTLHPDSLEKDPRIHRAGVFVTTFIAFFFAEMGDKTQLATVALAARFDALAEVVLGTTLGMLLADVPAVFIGEKLAKYIPMRLVRYAAATLFIALGLFTLMRPLEFGA